MEIYIDNINKFHNKFLNLQNYNYHDKIAIDECDLLYIQKKTPWRYFVRKIKSEYTAFFVYSH